MGQQLNIEPSLFLRGYELALDHRHQYNRPSIFSNGHAAVAANARSAPCVDWCMQAYPPCC